MDPESVLNPALYRRLLRRFGEVRITHQGERRVARVQRDLLDRPRLVVRQHGEAYRVRCCFCRDQNFQLTINHMYGRRDEETGRQLLHLAYCHSRNCLAVYENRVKLVDMLSAGDGVLEGARILPGRVVSEAERKVELPAPLTRLDQLPARHPARKCLIERGLDPDRVGRYYKVCYCGDSKEPVARNQIIIPVEMRGQLRGWQAMTVGSRSIGGRPLPPRYLSAPGMEASKLLYNLDRARQYRTAVVVKDPADVWAFGPMALCPITRKVSEDQRRKLLAVFRHLTLVLLLADREFARPDVRRLVAALRTSMPSRCAAVRLPPDTAAGPLTRAYIREYVVKQAAKQGVRVHYGKQE